MSKFSLTRFLTSALRTLVNISLKNKIKLQTRITKLLAQIKLQTKTTKEIRESQISHGLTVTNSLASLPSYPFK